jgi:hypothetical protein
MIRSIVITRTGWIADPNRVGREATEAANMAMAKAWYEKDLPEHFTTEAPRKYGYQARTKKYMLRKAKVMHHQRPLMWTGTMMQALRSFVEIKASLKKATLKMYGTQALNLSGHVTRRGNVYPDMKRELLTITEQEAGELSKEGARALQETYENSTATTRVAV